MISQEKSNRDLLFILFAAIVLFMQQSWVPGFHPDGYIYAGLSANTIKGNWLVPHFSTYNYDTFHMHPPFMFMLNGLFFSIIPKSWEAARFVGSIWSILAILILFKWIKSEKGRQLAFWVAIFYIINPHVMKLTRSPNLDIFLAFEMTCAFGFYWFAYTRGKLWHWLAVGAVFGATMMTKGPPAASIPAGIFLHLFLTKSFSKLKCYKPWLGFIFGLFVFSLWPLSLELSGNYQIFKDYLYHQVYVTVGRGRERQDFALWTYPWHMLKVSPHIFIFFIIGIIKLPWKKAKDHPLEFIFVSWFLAVMIPYSFVRWKFSHYIIPLYPAYAFIAAYGIYSLKDSFKQKAELTVRTLIPLVAVVLLCFPVTTNLRRDLPLIHTLDHLSGMQVQPEKVVLMSGSYGFLNLINLTGWIGTKQIPEQRDISYLDNIPKNTHAIFMHERYWNEMSESKKLTLKKRFLNLWYYPKFKLYLLLDKSLTELNQNSLFRINRFGPRSLLQNHN